MKLLKTIKHEYLAMLPPAIFFFISFMLILITKRLILSEYGISWSGLGAACAGAILVAKVVLIVDKLPFVTRCPQAADLCRILEMPDLFDSCQFCSIHRAYRSVITET